MAAQMSGLEPGGCAPHALPSLSSRDLCSFIHSFATELPHGWASELGPGDTDRRTYCLCLSSPTTPLMPSSPHSACGAESPLIPACRSPRDTCVLDGGSSRDYRPAPLRRASWLGRRKALVGCARKPDGSCVPKRTASPLPLPQPCRETVLSVGSPSWGWSMPCLLELSILSEQEAVFLKPAV